LYFEKAWSKMEGFAEKAGFNKSGMKERRGDG